MGIAEVSYEFQSSPIANLIRNENKFAKLAEYAGHSVTWCKAISEDGWHCTRVWHYGTAHASLCGTSPQTVATFGAPETGLWED